MQRYSELKWQSTQIFLLLLLVLSRKEVVAACVRVNNEELFEYNCEGGTLEDFKEVPDNAEKIRVSNMPVALLHETVLSRFGSSLLVFICSHCLIEEVSDGAFRLLRNLQQLSLDNNHLRSVRASWFEPGLIFLTYLDLNYNQIESLDTELFNMVPSLVDLRLSGNRLECLDFQTLSLLHDLKRIFLNENSNFGCPNALGKYLQARGIDYEPDPRWASQSHDRLHIGESYLPVNHMSTTSVTAIQSPSTMTLSPSSTQLYTFDSLQPFSPNQKFGFNQSAYYEPTVIPQRPKNYRKTQNSSSHLSRILSTSVVITNSLPTEPTTTECPNSTAFNGPICHLVLIIIATLPRISFCTWIQR